ATVGSGTVAVSIDDIKTITSAGGQAVDTIYFKEDRNGALKEDASNSIKLKLPAGYKWANAGTLQNNWGTDVTALATVEKGSDDRELIIKTTGTTTSASYFQLNGATVDVDESIAKKGDVVVNLSGATTTTPNSFTIARYGEFNTGIAVYGDVPTIAAGKNGDTVSEIGAFKIEEEVKGSLIGGRTITFTLPEGARWGTAGTPLQAPTRSGDTKDGGIGEFTWTIVDNQDANRILKATIPAGADSSTAAKLIYEKAQIATAVDFSGDLTVEVGGTAGITGNLVLGKIVPAVTVAASEVKPVTLGLGAQPLGDITITEGIQEALNKDAAATTSSEADGGVNDYVVNVQLPLGVYFSGTPKVEVASGDMMIEASSVTVNQNGSDGSQGSLRFNVRSSSTTPSAIKISDVKVTADRTVPEGDIIVKVRGTAVNKSGFAGRGTAASAVIGKLVTPASGEVKADASFKIGDTKYTVNGMEKSMDVAPYIKNSRTYMPVRYVAEA
ncbi:copper amine oxidase N-terminal domain-containing protein, partial [Heliophilum fasciatum]|uniref:copper amine oxidase N-terminal domain-containing protein n=1 Tax=Heliophilum fasciatum TaxID=35700 RepID=UPI001A9BF99F